MTTASDLHEIAPPTPGTGVDGTPAWIVTRDDDVRAVLGDPRFGNTPVTTSAIENRDRVLEEYGLPPELFPYVTSSILDADGADHVRLRRLVSRAFTVRRVAALRPRVVEITATLLDALPGRVDLIAAFAYPLPITVICELVGVPEADRPMWVGGGEAVEASDPEAAGAALGEMVAYTHGLVERRRAEPADDLLTDMIRAQDEDGDRLSDVEMVTMVLALVTAGHRTTAHLIGNATHALSAPLGPARDVEPRPPRSGT